MSRLAVEHSLPYPVTSVISLEHTASSRETHTAPSTKVKSLAAVGSATVFHSALIREHSSFTGHALLVSGGRMASVGGRLSMLILLCV